jgi:hypothetical protein
MYRLGDIELSANCYWENEFEGSAIEREIQYTEDGRQIITQRRKQKFRKPILNCEQAGLTYPIVTQLADLRDSGGVVILKDENDKEIKVSLESIDGLPLNFKNFYKPTDTFKVKLNFIEVL